MCFVLVAAGGLAVQFFENGDISWDVELGPPTETPIVLRPTVQPTEQAEVVEQGTPQQVEYPGDGPVPVDTLRTLEDAVIPPNDLRDLAKRLQGIENIPLTVDAPVFPLQVGDKDVMWVTNVDTNENSQIDVTLQYVTEHVYFWIEDGISFDENILAEKLSRRRSIPPRGNSLVVNGRLVSMVIHTFTSFTLMTLVLVWPGTTHQQMRITRSHTNTPMLMRHLC